MRAIEMPQMPHNGRLHRITEKFTIVADSADEESQKKEELVNEIIQLQKTLITYHNDRNHLIDTLKQSRRYQRFLWKCAPTVRDLHCDSLLLVNVIGRNGVFRLRNRVRRHVSAKPVRFRPLIPTSEQKIDCPRFERYCNQFFRNGALHTVSGSILFVHEIIVPTVDTLFATGLFPLLYSSARTARHLHRHGGEVSATRSKESADIRDARSASNENRGCSHRSASASRTLTRENWSTRTNGSRCSRARKIVSNSIDVRRVSLRHCRLYWPFLESIETKRMRPSLSRW